MKTLDTIPENAQTVAQLAIAYPAALTIFTKYNIDYCCGGHRSLSEACALAGLDVEKIHAEILQTSPIPVAETLRPERWSSTFLVDFIVENHHTYVKHTIPELHDLLDKVCNRHGNDMPSLLTISEHFNTLSNELTSHMHKEEHILFPAIRQLDAQQTSLPQLVQAPIEVMEHEHQVAGDLIKTIRTLTNDYTPPEFACPTLLATYQKLNEFDTDLIRHIHLENNILFERYK